MTGASATAEFAEDAAGARRPQPARPAAVDAAPAAAAGEIGGRHAGSRSSRSSSPRATSPRRSASSSRASARTSATRCCSASPAPARPSPWRKVIEATQRPALILAPNKTLAAQLYGEFKSFFPNNAVEYFVSYYDYYQPEAYVPRTDTYIEKESSINEQIDRMRHAATRAVLERDDVIIVASVSCIYGIGSVETYTAMTFSLQTGDKIDQRQVIADLVALQYKRIDRRFHARRVPRARRHARPVPGALRGPRLAHRFLRRRDRVDRRVRSADRRQDQRPRIREDLRQQPLRDAAPDAAAIDGRDQAGAEGPARRAARAGPPAGGAAAGAAHAVRPRNAGSDRLLRRASRTIRAISPAAAPASRRRPCSNICPTMRWCSPTRATSRCRRSAACIRATSPQGDAGRIRLPPALLHGQPAAAVRGMGGDAAADRACLGDPRRLGAGAHAGRVRRAGDPPDRPDRPAGGDPPRPRAGRRSPGRSAPRRAAPAIARW